MTMTQIGDFTAYVARPAGPPRAAIIVIQEIFGVNAGIRQKCDRLAADGYLSVAPDLFWRLEPGVTLDPDVPEQLAKAFELFTAFGARGGSDESILDIEATIRAIRHGEIGAASVQPGGQTAGETAVQKVGCVGYCLGGMIAYKVAARTDISASVGYYGVMIDQLLSESHAIAHPLMLHIPTMDHFVGAEAQAAMHAGLDAHPKVTLHDYPGLDHGFATETGARRDDAGAALADSRTAAFFAEHLG